jgi:malate dehydrogenase
LIGGNPATLRVPVVGGHSGVTILPLLSQVQGTEKLSQEQIEKVTNRIQFGGDEVVKAKDGAGSATLSMAFAGARFALNIVDAVVAGKTGIVECTYVHLDADKSGAESIKNLIGGDLEYFSVPVELGVNGVQKILPIGEINEFEKKLFAAATSELKGNIVKGSTFITEDSKL